MAKKWKKYQEQAASFFRGLGLDAETDVTVKGVRTEHDIDVLVKSHHVGFDVTWIVECKHWRHKVSKLHVLALREIVTDLGADRGILLCEVGFQSGAIEAATLTNVQVTSLANVRKTAASSVCSMRFRDFYDRVLVCKERYWDIPKSVRIERGLRPDVGGFGYSGARAIDLLTELLSKSFRGVYPIENNSLFASAFPGLPQRFASANKLLSVVEPMVKELEAKLTAVKRTRRKP